MAGLLEQMLSDPAYNNLYFDISWDEVAKYIICQRNHDYPIRLTLSTNFLTGSCLEPIMWHQPARKSTWKFISMYEPLWQKLTPEAREKILKTNYERLFDKARMDVRAWEKTISQNKYDRSKYENSISFYFGSCHYFLMVLHN